MRIFMTMSAVLALGVASPLTFAQASSVKGAAKVQKKMPAAATALLGLGGQREGEGLDPDRLRAAEHGAAPQLGDAGPVVHRPAARALDQGLAGRLEQVVAVGAAHLGGARGGGAHLAHGVEGSAVRRSGPTAPEARRPRTGRPGALARPCVG